MALHADEPEPEDRLPVRYWKAVAELPAHRDASLAALESCFRDGAFPGAPSGAYSGRLLTTTVAPFLDGLGGALARLWMPWKGKEFDPEVSDGRNRFTPGFRPVVRLLWPGYRGVRETPSGLITAFRFVTWEGPSVLFPDTKVLKIDYDFDENPAWPIRPILDELVQVDRDVNLGQALMRWRGSFRRAAWFSLC